MKKNTLKLLAAAFIMSTTAVAFQSCSDNDDDEVIITNPATGIAADPANFKGEVKSGETVTLDATKLYKLTGSVKVRAGGTLVIPAGTRIEANGGTSSYILIEQGAKIFANGTATSPIVFTSPNPTPGSWGGVVICGKAPINSGATAVSEVGESIYGGTVANDNSGSLKFVRIEYAGAIYTGVKEFNGLSLFGVGNGTVIDNISMINGSDDGIEFFGGTVNVSNIISVANEDDAFDWTEGWNGTATNIYTKRRADNVGNRGIEADNNANNKDASPRSNPTIKNATFIGATSGESDGLKLREGTYASIDNVVLSNWTTGINVEHDQSVTYFNGQNRITKVKFDNVATKASVKATTGSPAAALLPNTYTEDATANGAGNGTATPTWAAGWAGI
ncbi:hypothetical protein [Chryseobacterium indoltheticum]|uniref:Right-handed parallel beta-helix repeat-containing protein n=1 Tax=Chryseobacterium indoltheticum TaxID=254 RepID=A0A381FIG3_9FLAO|nr:hypothetical protein [Chryseobacterium indoltheticum]AZA61019.1 hypothetical protein EG340_08145 [Chryseobacterium indoltheticum]SUX46273.1 Uncharacterised protein [Chryseobacterium indoltheticum]